MKKQPLIFIFLFSVTLNLFAQECNFEGYFLKGEKYPNNEDAFWQPNGVEVQGITNDGEYWYITTTDAFNPIGDSQDWGRLWKIHKSIPLGQNSIPSSGVSVIVSEDIPDLVDLWHWGDADHFKYNGKNYIIVPVDNGGNVRKFACFESNSNGLEYINFTNIPTSVSTSWCTINDEGKLFGMASGTKDKVYEYTIDWDELTLTNNHNVLSQYDDHELDFSNNANYTELSGTQGGEFSISDELLFIVSGEACLNGGAASSDGIHVFDTSNWSEIETSSMSSSSHFHFDWNPNCTNYHQPQGLTVWELDDESVPTEDGGIVRGDLHVLLFDYDPLDDEDHEVSLFHFSRKVYLDSDSNFSFDSPISGNINRPFESLKDAYEDYPIWDGAQLILKAGEYNGEDNIGTFDKKIRITSTGGSAIIGQQ